jgi:photosystem II stability/assembly factor-like uncharacterized protein
MARDGFVTRFFKPCAVAAFMIVLAACDRGGESISPPGIMSQPQSASIAEGGSATFSVAAAGGGALAYQWQRNGVDVPGATEATYTAGPETFSDSGAQIRVRVSNEGGVVVSDPATLKITAQCTGAQPNTGWCKVGPTEHFLVTQLDAVNANVAWVFAQADDPRREARVARTTDGGVTWTSNVWPPPADSYWFWSAQLRVVSETVAWASAQGMVFRSVDGGLNWTQLVAYPSALTRSAEVVPLDANVAWVSDHQCLHFTSDAGKSWATLPACNGVQALVPVSRQILWGLSPYSQGTPRRVVVSVDGGTTWTERALPITDVQVRAITAIDALTAWVVGDSGLILKTSDGGVTWVKQASGVEVPGVGGQLSSVRAIDARTVWAGGNVTLRTLDGGTTWSRVGGSSWNLRPIDAVTAWSSYERLAVPRTTDAGATWILRTLPPADYFPYRSNLLQGLNSRVVWGNAGRFLIRTSNGGASWSLVAPPPSHGEFDAFAATNERAVWSLGRSPSGALIERTLDAGLTWTLIDSQTELYAVTAKDEQTAWYGGVVQLKTSDGGLTWAVAARPSPPSPAYAPRVTSMTTASKYTMLWEGGYASVPSTIKGVYVGFVAKQAANWPSTAMATMSPVVPEAIAAVDEQTLWIVGRGPSGSEIYKTIDGGAIWTKQYAASGVTLYAITAVDHNNAWSVGTGGTVLHTMDGGAGWVSQPAGTQDHLFGVATADARTAWIFGIGGLRKTTTGGN